jgi:hypothetical protein
MGQFLDNCQRSCLLFKASHFHCMDKACHVATTVEGWTPNPPACMHTQWQATMQQLTLWFCDLCWLVTCPPVIQSLQATCILDLAFLAPWKARLDQLLTVKSLWNTAQANPAIHWYHWNTTYLVSFSANCLFILTEAKRTFNLAWIESPTMSSESTAGSNWVEGGRMDAALLSPTPMRTGKQWRTHTQAGNG